MEDPLLPALLLLVAACAPADPAGACGDYVSALDACYVDAGASAAPLERAFCAPYAELTGGPAADAEERLQCFTDAVVSGDCATLDGADAAFASAENCP